MDECKVIDIFSRVDRAPKNQKKRIKELLQLASHGEHSPEEEAGGLGRIRRLLSSAVPIKKN